MKIYFSGSIRGGRQDQALYFEIIKLLSNYGQVLTEHIGQVELSDKGEDFSEEYIFKRDVDWVEQADAVVAEVTTPSLGVGYELGIAEKFGKKVICLYRPVEGKKLSAMILGNNYFLVRTYQTIEEAKAILDKELVNKEEA